VVGFEPVNTHRKVEIKTKKWYNLLNIIQKGAKNYEKTD